MSSKKSFHDLLWSYEEQSTECEESAQWIEEVYMVFRDYLKVCEDNNKKPTIPGLKKEIVKLAKSDGWEFE